MTQTNNRFLDELSKLLTDAAGAAQGMRREVETLMKAQGERILRDMDVVQREEFEAVKEMATKARDENEAAESTHCRPRGSPRAGRPVAHRRHAALGSAFQTFPSLSRRLPFAQLLSPNGHFGRGD